jgi:putative transcriptional regulator
MRKRHMDAATVIKRLREENGLSRKEFSIHTGIPVRTVEDWEAGRRTPPDYIPKLISYQFKYEKMMMEQEKKSE